MYVCVGFVLILVWPTCPRVRSAPKVKCGVVWCFQWIEMLSVLAEFCGHPLTPGCAAGPGPDDAYDNGIVSSGRTVASVALYCWLHGAVVTNGMCVSHSAASVWSITCVCIQGWRLVHQPACTVRQF